MLELKQITKTYETGGESVQALRGVDLSFRKSEFVSILGQSGCGKTTLLNIMGGLDQYTSGDLIINGISTKKYNDADWDAYRNHSVGFVFQSYNLIPHQTVLANVELALTLSGVSEEERRRRAVEALEEVGLGDQLNKKPAQMSGGQMQRVAIARALINNPDILLADEPTGALDSETSVQIMALLKNIAADKLVIMVTHNPDLAAEYSTRIVNLSDGKVVGDSNPYTPQAEAEDGSGRFKNKSMSFKTALQLSLNNLMTKKARTLLTAFAGSIGIIGIALILSVSSGFQNYIDQMEGDTLTSYPLTLNSEKADFSSMLGAFANAKEEDKKGETGKIKEQQVMTQMLASIGTNDLGSFKNYTEKKKDSELKDCFNAIQYSYGVKPQLYLPDFKYGVQQIFPSTVLSSYMSGMQQSAMAFSNSDTFFELVDNEKMQKDQYTVVKGKWPEKYNEVVLVLESKNSMSDYFAYSLGLKDPNEMKSMISKIMSGEQVEVTSKDNKWTYNDLLNIEYSLVPSYEKYQYNSGYNVWEDMSTNEAFMKNLVQNSEKVKVTCIAVPNKDNTSGNSKFGVGYLPSLTQHIIKEAGKSDIVKQQQLNTELDVFSGKTFEDLKNKSDQGLGFGDMISIDEAKLASAIGGKMSASAVEQMIIENATAACKDLNPEQTVKDIMTKATAQASVITNDILNNSSQTGNIITINDPVVIQNAYDNNQDTSEMSAPINKITKVYCDAIRAQLMTAPISGTRLELMQQLIGTPEQPGLLFMALGSEDSVNATTAYAAGEALLKTSENIPAAMAKTAQDMGSMFNIDPSGIASAFTMKMDEAEITRLISSYMSSGENASCDENLRKLGYADINQPYSISYYMKNFESKEKFMDFIDGYNDKMEKSKHDEKVISYTDITGVLLKSVKKITNAVSYVLIAFVAISLVVSSIMIGVITYISVLERTKEIGILRAIGASKKDISRIFNAETVIVGLCAGVIGIVTSLILLIPINAILIHLTKIAALKAVLPLGGAIILILISIFLTFIAGLIPSGMASKKDPVVALRSE